RQGSCGWRKSWRTPRRPALRGAGEAAWRACARAREALGACEVAGASLRVLDFQVRPPRLVGVPTELRRRQPEQGRAQVHGVGVVVQDVVEEPAENVDAGVLPLGEVVV